MLKIETNTGRTYEERMGDALAALPLISGEWTNYNPSDPGITILENLIAFETLQGTYIDDIGNRARFALLKMAGFTPKKGKCARLLLSADILKEQTEFGNSERFLIGDLVFETRSALSAGGRRLTGVFSSFGGSLHDLSFLTDRVYNTPADIFGERPKVGDCIYFIADSLPGPGEDTFFYIAMDIRVNRNPVEDRADNIFAALSWECYTEAGFQEMKVKDFTGAFLSSGEIKLRMPDAKACIYDKLPMSGFCIRATLTHAHYDIRPRVTLIAGFLFEVWQKDSRALCLTFQKKERVTVVNPLGEEAYILCFCKEKKGPSYHRYELQTTKQQRGRYCLYSKEENGDFSLEFDPDSYGFGPARVKDAIRVVIYSEEIMRQYRVGTVLGYDEQEFSLPLSHIVPDTFCLIAKRTTAEGELFDFVRPGKYGDGALTYRLSEIDGRVIIEDAGDFIGAELFMGGISVTEGPRGNIRPGGQLTCVRSDGRISFYNPGPGTGGAFRETLEEVRMRFREDVYTPYTCVTAGDYERIVSMAPGLCIRKVHAVMDPMQNLVHISVLPQTGEEHPGLSEEYLKVIDETIFKRRLITTRYQILPPVYTAVAARATVYVKRRYTDSKELIRGTLKELLNYPESDRNFGEPLRFEDVFRILEELDCVEYVYELSLAPQNKRFTKMKGADIYPAENCLLYPGDIDIETITYER